MESSGFCSRSDTREAELVQDTGKDGDVGWGMGQRVVEHGGQIFFFTFLWKGSFWWHWGCAQLFDDGSQSHPQAAGQG